MESPKARPIMLDSGHRVLRYEPVRGVVHVTVETRAAEYVVTGPNAVRETYASRAEVTARLEELEAHCGPDRRVQVTWRE